MDFSDYCGFIELRGSVAHTLIGRYMNKEDICICLKQERNLS
ncbi:hypothetical protein VCRA2113O326_20026 [Vibrio crassostreae]|nr:hypothetical protein VCRA2113O326_20026 [Vibrio crassostreae]CAK2917793.1 hypothetical protein VCRA2113O321_40262 [Vibrio crassostreae]CAK3675423.1 hypothetical protein VCRA2125O343_40267 [Vibrio crassostreae]